MRLNDVVDQCLDESGARGVSSRAREVALVGLALVPDGAISLRRYRKRIKTAFLSANPECGSVFAIIVLPILISVISAWISRWILNRKEAHSIRLQAYAELLGSSPSWVDTLTSINTPTRTQEEPET